MFTVKRNSLDGKKKVEKHAEIKAEVDGKIKGYKAAQKKQLTSGGPGPVADYETMAIVNEHAGKYSIELPEEDPAPTEVTP